MIWALQEIQEALSLNDDIIKRIKPQSFGRVQFNSKDVVSGDIFIALQGYADGHEFTADACAHGASLIIVSKDVPDFDPSCYIKVDHCLDALSKLAHYKRANSQAKFIGVTGSVGKTSTKEALALMLSGYGRSFMSRANFNNHLGVLINLASMPSDTEYAVIEMGMNAQGEIRALTQIVKPDIAIITAIAEGHLGFFDSVEQIADAKCEIYEGLDPINGVAILNRDIATYDRAISNIKKIGRLSDNIKTFGEHKSDVIFEKWKPLAGGDNQVSLSYKIKNQHVIEFSMPYISKHLAFNFASCFACLDAMGLDFNIAIKQIQKYKPLKGRGNIVNIVKNNVNIQIICDYYNSNPASLRAALEDLRYFQNKNKIAILGDMRELGKHSKSLHQEMADYILSAKVDVALLVGEEIKPLYSQMIDDVVYSNIVSKYAKNIEELLELLENDDILKGDNIILIKGSRGVALEKAAKYLGVQDVL